MGGGRLNCCWSGLSLLERRGEGGARRREEGHFQSHSRHDAASSSSSAPFEFWMLLHGGCWFDSIARSFFFPFFGPILAFLPQKTCLNCVGEMGDDDGRCLQLCCASEAFAGCWYIP